MRRGRTSAARAPLPRPLPRGSFSRTSVTATAVGTLQDVYSTALRDLTQLSISLDELRADEDGLQRSAQVRSESTGAALVHATNACSTARAHAGVSDGDNWLKTPRLNSSHHRDFSRRIDGGCQFRRWNTRGHSECSCRKATRASVERVGVQQFN